MTDSKHTAQANPDLDLALRKALSDSLRHRILIALDERGEASPKELAEEFNETVEKVAYHFRYLAGKTKWNPHPMVELVDTDTRRGGTQHFYRAIVRPVVDVDAAEDLPRKVREEQTAPVVDLLKADLELAVKEGTIDDHPQRTLLRMRCWFDEQGMADSAEATMALLARLQEIEAESLERERNGGARTRRVSTGILAYHIPNRAPKSHR